MPYHEAKRVPIGRSVIQVAVFETFFEMSLGNHSFGSPTVRVMMSHDDAETLMEAMTELLANAKIAKRHQTLLNEELGCHNEP